jgi:DnaJ-class molecular chaperone
MPLRRIFRRSIALAKKRHPDLNPVNKKDEEQFKEVSRGLRAGRRSREARTF